MDDWIADENFSPSDRHPPHHLNTFLTSIERLINQRDMTENRANTELSWERGFISFPSRCSADSSSELFHEHTTLLQDTIFPQPSSISRASNWTYIRLRIARTLNWAESKVSNSLALLSRFKFEALPRTYDLPTTLINWPSIQLNIHTTENCANTELGWGRDAFSHDSADSNLKLFH